MRYGTEQKGPLILATAINKGAGRRRKGHGNAEDLTPETQLPVPEDKLDEQDRYKRQAIINRVHRNDMSQQYNKTVSYYVPAQLKGNGCHFLKEIMAVVKKHLGSAWGETH